MSDSIAISYYLLISELTSYIPPYRNSCIDIIHHRHHLHIIQLILIQPNSFVLSRVYITVVFELLCPGSSQNNRTVILHPSPTPPHWRNTLIPLVHTSETLYHKETYKYFPVRLKHTMTPMAITAMDIHSLKQIKPAQEIWK